VLSAGPGVVGFAGLIGGVGVVTVRHGNGVETTYEPVAASVRAGDPVLAGRQVGVIRGRLAQCARVCLAWGLRRGASYLDPLALVGAVRVRLLPMLPVR
jgi:murein DD-endopeptidase MepM/ murein hydrolase activator NlpD